MAQTRRQAALAAAGEPANKRSKTESTDAKPAKGAASSIQVGDPLPDVDVVLQNEEPLNLAKSFATGIVVLFAYPKASTPGCTRQTSSFGADYGRFKELGAAVFGISADSPRAQTTFKEKTGVDFDLISDATFALLGPLGARKNPRGVIRSHWVFVDGKAVLVEHSVKPDDSSARTLAAVQEAKGVSEPEDAKPEEDEKPEPKEEAAEAPAEKAAEEPAEEGNKADAEPKAPEPFLKPASDAPDREATEEASAGTPEEATAGANGDSGAEAKEPQNEGNSKPE